MELQKAVLAIQQRSHLNQVQSRNLMIKYYITAFVIAAAGALSIVNAATTKLSISIKPDQPTFAQGEPVVIDVTLRNNQSTAQQIPIQEDWENTLEIALFYNGASIPKTPKKTNSGGFSYDYNVQLKPGQSIELHIVLNEIFSINEQGKYVVSVAVGADESKTFFTIGYSDPVALKAKFRKVWEEYNDPKTTVDRNAYLVKVLALSEHESALEFQKELFARRQELSFGELKTLVHTLVKTHRFDAVDFMLMSMLTEKADNNTRMILFYETHVAGINSFDYKTRALLTPYLQEIQASGPVEITD